MSRSLNPVRRAARLLRLLAQPRTLDELQDLLQISPAQLRRDLTDLRAEGWPIEEQGGGPRQPKSVWLA